MVETNHVWKYADKSLNSNKNGSIVGLKSLLGRFEKDPKLMTSFGKIIQKQVAGVIILKGNNRSSHLSTNQLKVQNSELYLHLHCVKYRSFT